MYFFRGIKFQLGEDMSHRAKHRSFRRRRKVGSKKRRNRRMAKKKNK